MINIAMLRKYGVKTFSELAILVSCEEKITMKEIIEKSGVTDRGIERYMIRKPGMIRRVAFKGEYEGPKSPLYHYIRTAKATKILERAGVIPTS